MRISLGWLALLLFLTSTAGGQNTGFPFVSSVEPQTAKIGDTVTARGTRLGSDAVTALYLTDGTVDIKVEVLDQNDTTLKFKIPRTAKPGRFALMVRTSGPEGRLIEEPVKITIEPETAR